MRRIKYHFECGCVNIFGDFQIHAQSIISIYTQFWMLAYRHILCDDRVLYDKLNRSNDNISFKREQSRFVVIFYLASNESLCSLVLIGIAREFGDESQLILMN